MKLLRGCRRLPGVDKPWAFDRLSGAEKTHQLGDRLRARCFYPYFYDLYSCLAFFSATPV